MTSPTGNGQQVQLAEFNPFDSKGLQLWVPSPPRPQDAGFYQIQPNTDDDSALAGLFDGGDDVVHDGMEIGINSSTPVTSNNLWMTLNVIPYPSCMYHVKFNIISVSFCSQIWRSIYRSFFTLKGICSHSLHHWIRIEKRANTHLKADSH